VRGEIVRESIADTTDFGGDAEAVEAAACKAALSGFESRRHLQFHAAWNALRSSPGVPSQRARAFLRQIESSICLHLKQT
jgi:hypothetical protein